MSSVSMESTTSKRSSSHLAGMSYAEITKRNLALNQEREENAVMELIAYCHKTIGNTPDYGEIAQAVWGKDHDITRRHAILTVGRLKAKGRLQVYVTHLDKLVVRIVK